MKPKHYTQVCVTAYTKDLAVMDTIVEKIKGEIPSMSRSELIRVAIQQFDVEKYLNEKGICKSK